MGKDLESPYVGGVPDWDALYRARGDEVSRTRPIFTGDVFTGVQLPGSSGRVKARSVVVLQHPCSMRSNGVDLAWHILVVEVSNRKIIEEPGWTGGNFNLMPFPDLRPDVTSQARDQAANFDNIYTVEPGQLVTRIATLSPFGVNLLLQRWVHYSSRVVVPTQIFHEQTVAFYEEADLIEEWCDEAPNDDLRGETLACLEWLRTDRDGTTYQEMLKNPQSHSMIRRAMRKELRERNQG
ncbi:hypothetical protein [Propionimicrobium sp. PCR01-08-3]|uniref:hypothetical protein n=1 Tax=Propionimicrobium sp. PCR01-08-3 TaxID=3052086 RepID=UPI00255C7B51|nr:hypothetical protein [Propionimicrobium sp. PCR01-08-3]WIY82897.1 hypothetical protein QQ658_00610 [Propionimicrobium sp. PCR01-08-3]